jgi:DNA/RNA endonuclease YhcR with UshA esterase domain
MPRLVRPVVPALMPALLALALVAIRPGGSIGADGQVVPLATVDWPPSTTVVVGEVMTGGASASDEFVELYNGGQTGVDLAGLEVAYVTSSGSTVTRKATWTTTTLLEPGRHLLLANGSGVYASVADAVYTGGLAATGGAMVVRPIGGGAIDAIGWGDAANAFVEGGVAPAPPAGSSLERRPGGSAGNGIDTNDNLTDWLLNAAPIPQNLAAPAVPVGTTPTSTPSVTPTPAPTLAPTPTIAPTPTPAQTVTPSATATPSPTLVPTPSASPTPVPSPSATPTGSPTPTPTPEATAAPTPSPTSTPTPPPTPVPTPTPTASPAPATIDIAVAREQPADSRVRIRGIVTVEPGRIVDDRTIAIEDATAGILVRLDGGRKDLALTRGVEVVIEGRLTARYGALEVRLDGDDPLEIIGGGVPPAAAEIRLADLGEATEARLVTTSGVIVDIDRAKSGTTTIILEDESGRGRVVAFGAAGTLPDALRKQATVAVSGIGGQRATAKDRLDGYRIWIRDGSDLQVQAAAPTASPSGSPKPSGSPGAAPDVLTIAVARARAGQEVVVEGTVTSPGGLLDTDGRRVTIEDGTGAILLRLVARETAPPIGSRVRAAGSTGTYYGAPQLSATASVTLLGKAAATARSVAKAPGTGSEWELVRVTGTVVDVRRYGQAWRAELRLADGSTVPIVGLARAGISVDRIREGQVGAIVGIVRRAYPSATDRRFAVLPRTRTDLDLSAGTKPGQAAGASHPASSGRASGSTGDPGSMGGSTSTADTDSGTTPTTIEAAELSANVGRFVRIGGLVVRVATHDVQGAGSTLVIDDGSGMATLRFVSDAAAIGATLQPGDLIEVGGRVETDEAGWVIVVDDPADVVVAGQAAAASPSPGPGGASVGDADGAADAVEAGAPPGGAQPEATTMTPLMGAAGAGAVVAMILATAAAGARWRRWRAERLASREATVRLRELLSEPEGQSIP